MTDQSNEHLDIRERIRELPVVEADTAFRDRLRSAFADGRLEEPAPAQSTRPAARTRGAWWRWLAPVATAAAAVLVIVFVSLNGGPELRVAAGQGEMEIDGRSVALGDGNAGTVAIAGSSVETPPGSYVDLLADGVWLFEVAAGTKMSIPEVPGRWYGKSSTCTLYAGELRVKTGPRFAGSELVVYTPDGMVQITGTMLSIQSDDGGTCVCVLEGVAHVGVDAEDLEPVNPGFRKIMLRDGTVEIIPVKEMHRDGVLDFDRRVGNMIEHD